MVVTAVVTLLMRASRRITTARNATRKGSSNCPDQRHTRNLMLILLLEWDCLTMAWSSCPPEIHSHSLMFFLLPYICTSFALDLGPWVTWEVRDYFVLPASCCTTSVWIEYHSHINKRDISQYDLAKDYSHGLEHKPSGGTFMGLCKFGYDFIRHQKLCSVVPFCVEIS